MNTITVQSHTRRTGKRTGIPKPKPQVDPGKPFFCEPLENKRPRFSVRLKCKVGLHSMQLTGETRYLSMHGRTYLKYACRDCGKVSWRLHNE